MDLVYVVGRGSAWGNNELRYSLRSIEKNGVNVGRVFVVGYKPRWLGSSSTYLQVQDETPTKHINILHCLMRAVDCFGLEGDFLYSSDDHFYIRQTDFDNYPYFLKGELPETVAENDGAKAYHTSLVSTRTLLYRWGLTTHNFAWHGNTHFDADVMRSAEFRRLVNQAAQMPEGCEPTCLMLNYLLSVKPFDITEREDKKLGRDITAQNWSERVGERECVSSVPEVWNTYLAEYLQENFKKRSRYEL